MAIAGTTSAARLVAGAATLIALMGAALVPAGTVRAASGSELFITEYVEGSATNQAIEIYNPTDIAVSLSASSYMLAFYFDGSTMIGGGVPLIGVLPAGGTWVVTPTDASDVLLAKANQAFGTTWFTGNDAVALLHGGAAVDVIGQIGMDPGTGWGSGTVTTTDHTLRRKASVTAGDPNGTDAFDPSAEWDGYPIDTFDGLGWVGTSVNQPVAITCPASVRTTRGVAVSAPVSATDPDGTIASLVVSGVAPVDPGTVTISGVTAASITGGTATGSLSISPSTPAGDYAVTVTAANDEVAPQTATCTVAVTVQPATAGGLQSLIDGLVAGGEVAPTKAGLLQQRMERVVAAMAAGRSAEAAGQLRALTNQAAGLAPRWMSTDAADLIRREAVLLASSL